MKIFNAIWNDPVWSKVIGAIILGLIFLVLNRVFAGNNKKNFRKDVRDFWSRKVTLWICASGFFILFLLNLAFAQIGLFNYIFILFFIYFIYFLFNNKNKIAASANHTIQKDPFKIIFKSENAKSLDFNPGEEYIWKGGSPVGEIGRGKLEFENGVINIERYNLQGRFIIRLLKYLPGDQHASFIPKNITAAANRIIGITYEAKTIGGSHNLWFIAKSPNTYNSIHNAVIKDQISDTTWQNFDHSLTIPASREFIIYLEDREIEKAPSTVQIRKLVIKEL